MVLFCRNIFLYSNGKTLVWVEATLYEKFFALNLNVQSNSQNSLTSHLTVLCKLEFTKGR